MEIWKDIKGYEDSYQVSNLGRVKSLDRKGKHYKGGSRIFKGKILAPSKDASGYKFVSLSNNGKQKSITVHQLVAITFLNHVPCGIDLVVNHIDFNKINNSINNLEIVSNRENSNKKHLKSSSNHTGVSWYKSTGKWRSTIYINGKRKHLGYFTTELEASNAYQKALDNL